MAFDLDFLRRQNQSDNDKDQNGILSQGKDMLMDLVSALDNRLGGALGSIGLVASDLGKSDMQSYSVGTGSVPYDENHRLETSRPGDDAPGAMVAASQGIAPSAPDLSPQEIYAAAAANLPEGVMGIVQESIEQMRSWVPQGGPDAVMQQADLADLGVYERVQPYQGEKTMSQETEMTV